MSGRMRIGPRRPDFTPCPRAAKGRPVSTTERLSPGGCRGDAWSRASERIQEVGPTALE